MSFNMHKCNWCNNWEVPSCDKDILENCYSCTNNNFNNIYDYLKILMKSKRKVKLLLEIYRKTKIIQGTICTVTDNTVYIIEDKCIVPTAISISVIKHIIPL